MNDKKMNDYQSCSWRDRLQKKELSKNTFLKRMH